MSVMHRHRLKLRRLQIFDLHSERIRSVSHCRDQGFERKPFISRPNGVCPIHAFKCTASFRKPPDSSDKLAPSHRCPDGKRSQISKF
jgi:hypothetical protein